MCVLPAYMSCIRWSLMPPPKNLGSFPRASQHMSCVAVSVHVFLPFSRLAAIFSNRPQQTAGVSGSRARRTRRKKKKKIDHHCLFSDARSITRSFRGRRLKREDGKFFRSSAPKIQDERFFVIRLRKSMAVLRE